MAEFINEICGVTLPEPVMAVCCFLLVAVFFSLMFGCIRAVFGHV